MPSSRANGTKELASLVLLTYPALRGWPEAALGELYRARQVHPSSLALWEAYAAGCRAAWRLGASGGASPTEPHRASHGRRTARPRAACEHGPAGRSPAKLVASSPADRSIRGASLVKPREMPTRSQSAQRSVVSSEATAGDRQGPSIEGWTSRSPAGTFDQGAAWARVKAKHAGGSDSRTRNHPVAYPASRHRAWPPAS